MLTKKALVIGIDDYPNKPLNCCVADAQAVAALLATNGDDDETDNFDVKLLTSGGGDDVSNLGLMQSISAFFNSDTPAETAVLYFAGHGFINPDTDAGYIVGTDGRPGAYGMSLAELLHLANHAAATIHSSVIILDCCHAGHLGQINGLAANAAAVVGKGVTILTACNADQKSKETGGHGVFTELLLHALEGGAADVRGHVTPAAVYTHIDQALGAHEQRPLYKANVHRFVTLRQVAPKIAPKVLKRIAVHFPHPDMVYPLDPSYEPDRQSVADSLKQIPVDPVHAAAFKELQMYNRQGLVVPVDADHMFFAAMNSKACKLTALGKHYQRLAAAAKNKN